MNPEISLTPSQRALKDARTRLQIVYFSDPMTSISAGAGIAQWLEHRTRD